jgi:type II secretory pathway pseudopilin PulG
MTMTARRGITLLELILALALSVIVLAAIGWAIRLHMLSLDSRRAEIEQAQLARAVLKIIADDLRSTVAYNTVDLAEAARLSAGGSVPGLSDEEGEGGEGGDGGEGDGEGMPDDDSEGEDAQQEQDIASDLTPAAIPGIYGNQYQLQIDVSRLPRIEDFDPAMRDPAGGLNDLPSEVKSVAYYLQPNFGQAQTEEATLSRDGFGLSADLAAAQSPAAGASAAMQGWGRGLVRRALDRAATQWALDNGDMARLDRTGQMMALEIVSIEFRYFDGQTWQMSWDTQENGGLPVAVAVAIAISTSDEAAPPPIAAAAIASDGATTASLLGGPLNDPNIKVYQQVIRIPTAEPTVDEDALEIEAE